MITLLIVIDYYLVRLKSLGTSSTLVSLSHSVMILCSFLIIDKILKRLACTVKNSFRGPVRPLMPKDGGILEVFNARVYTVKTLV